MRQPWGQTRMQPTCRLNFAVSAREVAKVNLVLLNQAVHIKTENAIKLFTQLQARHSLFRQRRWVTT
jgi:hypothetical protein